MALEKKSMHSSIILHSRVEWKYIAKVERCYFIAKTIQYERMRFSISKEKWSLLQPWNFHNRRIKTRCEEKTFAVKSSPLPQWGKSVVGSTRLWACTKPYSYSCFQFICKRDTYWLSFFFLIVCLLQVGSGPKKLFLGSSVWLFACQFLLSFSELLWPRWLIRGRKETQVIVLAELSFQKAEGLSQS